MNETLAIWLIVAIAAWLLWLAVDKDPFKPEREEEDKPKTKVKKIKSALINNKDGFELFGFNFEIQSSPHCIGEIVFQAEFLIGDKDICDVCPVEFIDGIKEQLPYELYISFISGSTYNDTKKLEINFSTYC